MSDNLVDSRSDGDDSVHPYQSVWMSHWKHTSCKSADQACTHVRTNYDLKKDMHDSKRCLLVDNPELGMKISECVRESQQVGETRAANSKNGSHTSMSSLKKIRNESLDHRPLQGSSLIVSKIFQDELKGLASKYLPFQFLSKGLALHSTGEEQNNQPNAILSSEEHLSKTKQSSLNKVFLLQDSTTCQDQKPDLECNDVPKHSNCGLFKSRRLSHLTSPRLNKLHNECYSLPSLPLSINEGKTMRISTTIDSFEESSMGSPKISKTTRHFLVSEKVSRKTDVNVSEEARMFRESTITAKLKENHLRVLFAESTDFSIHNQNNASRLQSLGSSLDIVKDIGSSAVCPTNDSSAFTNTMDLDLFHENNFAGLSSDPLNKDLELELNRKVQSQNASKLAGESSGHLNSELPDINKELTIQENGADMKETSTSTTQSLDLFKSSKSTSSANDSSKQNLNSRWVRRLKCNGSSDYASGNRNSQAEGASMGKKVVQINLSRSKPTIGESDAKKQKIYDGRKNRETLLSHPWIHRWCTTMPDKKLEPMVVCEPECSRMALNEYEGKHLPSIAAMALMGKAMNGFQPCKFIKKGSYSVWDT